MTTQPPVPPSEPPPPNPGERIDALRGGVPRWAIVIVVLACALVAFFIVRPLFLPSYHIPSMAMAPTVVDGDRVVGQTFSTNPERGEIVVFERDVTSTTAPALMMRVIATGGETIEFRDGAVFIDGLLLVEPYLAEPNSTSPLTLDVPNCVSSTSTRCVIPEGYMFVMGDNRRNSFDSRRYGPIPTDAIQSKIFMKIMPFGDIGGL